MAIDITKVLNVIQEKIGSANTSVDTQELIYLTKVAKAAGSGSVIESYANSDVFPTANNTVKKLAFDELNRTLYMNSDGTWAALDITVPDAAAGPSSYTFQGSNYGYTSGGGSPLKNTIDKFPFSSDGNASDVGDLSTTRYYVAGQSSSVSGYVSGGGGDGLTIDKFPFATDDNATDVADLATVQQVAAGQSSPSYGYLSGGLPYPITSIQKFSFSADTNATNVGDITQARRFPTGQSSTDYGYTSGGSTPTFTMYNTIDKFPFASDGNATDVGNLTVSRQGPTGQSSSDYGYSSGGVIVTPAYVNNIDKFLFATDGNATDVGDLTLINNAAAGQSSTDYGYTSGGRSPTYSPTYHNVIDKFPFSSDGNAADVGDLTVARGYSAGQQY